MSIAILISEAKFSLSATFLSVLNWLWKLLGMPRYADYYGLGPCETKKYQNLIWFNPLLEFACCLCLDSTDVKKLKEIHIREHVSQVTGVIKTTKNTK